MKLNKESIAFIDKQRLLKGWNKYDKEWRKKAGVSESTLKRFWRRKSISVVCFASICKAIEIDTWHIYVDWKDNDSKIPSVMDELKEVFTFSPQLGTTKFTISVRGVGILDVDEIAIVSAILEELKKILQRFDYCLRRIEELISQSELSKYKYLVSGIGIGIFGHDESYLVREIFNNLKSFFGDIFIINMNPVLEIA